MTIVTVTLNPGFDRTLSVPELRPGALHRARVLQQDLGGKGINVSRALAALGIRSRIVGLAGGVTGRGLHDGLAAAGFDVRFVAVDGETRQNLTLRDEASGVYTKINEPGPTIGPRCLAALRELIAEMARPGDLWAFCGSLPPGAPADLYAQLITLVQGLGARAFLDSSGPGLRAGLAGRPYGVKPNVEEAVEILGCELKDEEAHIEAVLRLQELAAAHLVALTRGAAGLILGLGPDLATATPTAVDAASPIGAGDSALAGLLWAVADGCDAIETARRAAACGTAAALQEGTGVGDRGLVESLLTRITVVSARRPRSA